jgi:hypothetical protein
MVTYDNATVKFYADGAADGTTADASGVFPFTELGSASGVSEFFNGFINEWAMWTSILNSTQAGNLDSNQSTYWGF